MRMAIKLLFITGVPWVFEVAAWLPIFLSDGSVLGSNYIYIFEISNLLNSLRGVIIFIIFIVLQRDVRRYLLKRIFNKRISVKNFSNQRTISNTQSFVTHGPTTSNTRLSISTSHTIIESEQQ